MLLAALSFFPVPAGAEEVSLTAESLIVDVKNDSYLARGGVRLVREGYSLLADSMVYHRLTEEAVAQGGVVLEKGDDLLKADRLRLNLDTQEGELLNGDLFLKKTNFRLHGKKVEKTGEKDYRVERGTFTTCNGANPSWHFELRDLEVTLEEYATGRDALFYVGKVPVLYFPYLVFPVKKERQSGFLLPSLGRSSKKGLYLSQPYYWAISPSQDATVSLDFQSERGVGSGLEYRYLRSHGSGGQLNGFGIYDTKVDKFRGEINQKHQEFFSPDTVLLSDLHAISDRGYYKDYGESVGEYNRQYWESTISADHKWERYNVTGLISYVEDLRSPTNDQSLQRLPALSFLGAGEKVGPLFFSLDAGAVNFQRVEGATGERLEVHPRLSYYTHPLPELDLSLYGGYQQRLYNAYGANVASGPQGVGIADAGALLALPLERVYNGTFRHVLTPSLGYSFVQQTRQDVAGVPATTQTGQVLDPPRLSQGLHRLPFFDWDDLVLPRSMVTWSVANSVTRKEYLESGVPTYRDVLYLRLSQGYQFSGSRRDLLTLVDEGHHLTDLMLESKISPVKGIEVGVDGRLNPVDGYLSTGNVSATATGEGGNSAELGYRFSKGAVNYLQGRFSYAIVKPLVATVLERFSVDKGAPLESRFALEYRHQCWSVTLSYSERPGNHEIMANFSLSGVGVGGAFRLF